MDNAVIEFQLGLLCAIGGWMSSMAWAIFKQLLEIKIILKNQPKDKIF